MDFDCTQRLDDCVDETFIEDGEKQIQVGILEINGLKHPLYVGENRVGRDNVTCSICIDNKILSKQHAVLDLGRCCDEDLIYDLGSCNKTRLGKLVLKPLVHYQLRNNANIVFGNISATFCRFPSPECGIKGKESDTDLKNVKLTNNLVLIDGLEYDIHDAPTQLEFNVSKSDDLKSNSIRQQSAKNNSEAEVYSANALQKTKSVGTVESSVFGNNVYELQTQIYFQGDSDDAVEKCLGETGANESDLNIKSTEKCENNLKEDAHADIFDLPTQIISVAKSPAGPCVQQSSKILSSPKFGTSIINNDSLDRSLLDGDEEMFEIPLNCKDSDSKHYLHNVPKNNVTSEALDISGIQTILKNDSGDETDPEDLFINSSKISGNPKVSFKHAEPVSANLDNRNTDTSSSDETDPEDIFCAATQKINENLLQVNHSKKQMLNTNNSDESTDLDDIVCAATQKFSTPPSYIVAATPDKDSSICSISSEKVTVENIYSAPTQLCDSQMFKTPMKKNVANVCKVLNEIDESKSESILQTSPKNFKQNLLPVAEGEYGGTICETSNIFSVPTQKILIEEDIKNVNILKEQNISEKNVKVVDKILLVGVEDSSDTSDIFIAPTQKFSVEKGNKIWRNVKQDNVIEETHCGSLDTHSRSKSPDNFISHEVSSISEGEDDNDIFNAPTQNISILKVENKYENSKTPANQLANFEYSSCEVSGNMSKVKEINSVVIGCEKYTEIKNITSLGKKEQGKTSTDMSDICLAPTQIINHNLQESIDNTDTNVNVLYEEKIIGSSDVLGGKKTEKLNEIAQSSYSKNSFERTTAITEGNSSLKTKSSSEFKNQEIINIKTNQENVINFENVCTDSESSLELPSSTECSIQSKELHTDQKNENQEVIKRTRKYKIAVSNKEACSSGENDAKILSPKCLKKYRRDTKPHKKIKKLKTENKINDSATVSHTEITLNQKEKPAIEYKESTQCGMILTTIPSEKGVQSHYGSENMNSFNNSSTIKTTPFLGTVSDLFQEITSGQSISSIAKNTSDEENKEVSEVEENGQHLSNETIITEVIAVKSQKIESTSAQNNADRIKHIADECSNYGTKRKEQNNTPISKQTKPTAVDQSPFKKKQNTGKGQGKDFFLLETLASDVQNDAISSKYGDEENTIFSIRCRRANSSVQESRETNQDCNSKLNNVNECQAKKHKNIGNRKIKQEKLLSNVQSKSHIDMECEKSIRETNIISNKRSMRGSSAVQYSVETSQSSNSKKKESADVEESHTNTQKKTGREQEKEKNLSPVASDLQIDTIANKFVEHVTPNERRRRTSALKCYRETNQDSSKQTKLINVDESQARSFKDTWKRKSEVERFFGNVKNKIQIDPACEEPVREENIVSNKRTRRGTSVVQYSVETNKSTNSKNESTDVEQSDPKTQNKSSRGQEKERNLLSPAASNMQIDTIGKKFIEHVCEEPIREENIVSNKRSRRGTSVVQYSVQTNQSTNSKKNESTDVEQSDPKTQKKSGRGQEKERNLLSPAASNMQTDTIGKKFIEHVCEEPIREENIVSNKRSRRGTSVVQYSVQTNQSTNSKKNESTDVEQFDPKTQKKSGRGQEKERNLLSPAASNIQIDTIGNKFIEHVCEEPIKEENIVSNKRSRRGTSVVQYSVQTNQSTNSKKNESTDAEESHTKTKKKTGRGQEKERNLSPVASDIQIDTIGNKFVEHVTPNDRRRRTSALKCYGETNQDSSKQTKLTNVVKSQARSCKNTGKRKSEVEKSLGNVQRKIQVDTASEEPIGEENIISHKRSRRRTSVVQYSVETNQSTNSKKNESTDAEESHTETKKKTGRGQEKEKNLLSPEASDIQIDTIGNKFVEHVTPNDRRKRTFALKCYGETNQDSSKLINVAESQARSCKNTGKRKSEVEKSLGNVQNKIQIDPACEEPIREENIISNKRSRRGTSVVQYSVETNQSSNSKNYESTDVEESNTKTPNNTCKTPEKDNSLLGTVASDIQIDTIGKKIVVNINPNKRSKKGIPPVLCSKEINSNSNQIELTDGEEHNAKNHKNTGQMQSEEGKLLGNVASEMQIDNVCNKYSVGEGNITSEKRCRRGTSGVQYSRTSVAREKNNIPDSSHLISPSRYSTRASTHLEWHVMFSMYSDSRLESAIKRLGGKVTEDPKECTVLVTDKVRRTYKFLCVIGQGKPIVEPKWLQESQEARSFLDPMDYLLNDEEAEQKFKFSLKKSLMLARQNRFLKDYTVHSTQKVMPPHKEMKGIVESCGGIFMKSIAGELPEKSFIISCESDKTKWTKLRKLNRPIVSVEMLLLGVLQQHLDIEAHIL